MGDRLVKYHGTMKFIDYKNCLKGIINFGEKEKINFFQTNKKNNIIKGKIYRIKKNHVENFQKNWLDQFEEDKKMKDIDKEICNISGSWIENLIIDN